MLPEPVHSILLDLHSEGLKGLVVGGYVRDSLLTQKFGLDIDIEVRLQHGQDFLNRFDSCLKNIAHKYQANLSVLNFEVRRLTIESLEIEFAPARREVYQSLQDYYSHAEFMIEIDGKMSDEEAFKRRDFTVNSMAYALSESDPNTLEFIDPFNGRADLEKRCLRSANPDFNKDPIRYFRAFRFAQKLNFSFHSDLKHTLQNFDLRGASFHGFFKEAMKAKNITFFKDSLGHLKDHKVPSSKELTRWFFLSQLHGGQNLRDAKDLLMMIALDKKLYAQFIDGHEEMRIQDLKLKQKESHQLLSQMSKISYTDEQWEVLSTKKDLKSLSLMTQARDFLIHLSWLQDQTDLIHRLESLQYNHLIPLIKKRLTQTREIREQTPCTQDLQMVAPSLRRYAALYQWLRRRSPTS